jgi:hypothetical protein
MTNGNHFTFSNVPTTSALWHCLLSLNRVTTPLLTDQRLLLPLFRDASNGRGPRLSLPISFNTEKLQHRASDQPDPGLFSYCNRSREHASVQPSILCTASVHTITRPTHVFFALDSDAHSTVSNNSLSINTSHSP